MSYDVIITSENEYLLSNQNPFKTEIHQVLKFKYITNLLKKLMCIFPRSNKLPPDNHKI